MTTQPTPEHFIPLPALFFLDQNLRITEVNREAEILLGQPGILLKGKPVEELFDSGLEDSELRHRLLELCSTTTLQPYLTLNLHSPGRAAMPCSIYILQTLPASGHEVKDADTVHRYVLILWPDAACRLDKQVADILFEGILILDEAMRAVAMNCAAEKLTGWNRHEILGKDAAKLLPALFNDSTHLPGSPGGCGICRTARLILFPKKDGGYTTLSLRSSSLQDKSGRMQGTVLCFQDCADSFYIKQVMASVADAVFSIDTEKTITSFNRAAERLTGWKAAEVIGQRCYDIMRSSFCSNNCLAERSSHLGGLPVEQPLFIKHKSKISVPVFASSTPLYDGLGNVIGNIEILRDRTVSLRSRLILDSIADGVFTVDKNWKITSFNRAAELITGWRQEEAIGKSCADIFHSSICGNNCAIAESLYTGEPVANRAITIRNHTGKKVPISISASPLVDHDGAIIGGVETFRDLSAINELRAQLHQRYTFDSIVSKSAAMQRLFAILPDIARSTSTVLISGESGTGKELVARALHTTSERSDKPFIVVNCAALPETLLESELFGYKAGAFTDAKKDRQGRFAAAEGGTIMLDEIGELPGTVQAKLLRVLQEKVYEPLGSNTSIHADVRIISATNRDLPSLVQTGAFRDDLFYRLNVVNITLPPLRERREDIALLIDHFINKFNAEQGKDIAGIDNEALTLLMRYSYPGNIRELENIIEFAFILCSGGYIQPQHLPEPFSSDQDQQDGTKSTASGHGHTLAEIEKQAILMSLARNHGHRNATCQELGISRDTLRRKIAAYESSSSGGGKKASQQGAPKERGKQKK
ncbi:MAG: sigma 54-interacting transcriptional regulator [Desulfobulbaceae bacterium]|nr:sigma 54-interacting transcriptional regulator [Desulfobulbaceae bacterium]